MIAAFGERFARTGRVPRELHRYLIDAQEDRLAGDYSALNAVAAEHAALQIARAEEFLAAAERLIGSIPANDGEHA